jgi:S-adenosylmethionine synthetase
MRVLITGASGVLGSAVYRAFKREANHQVLGLAFSQSIPGLERLDLTNMDETDKVFAQFKPDCMYHSSRTISFHRGSRISKRGYSLRSREET